ncbi:mitogen-activated protein kinase 15-like isoform X3 [Aotus nancymaae]|uniref:mitogen-activated protein kinase 15-like isoform X3 n=1 Tax=Aotus nancymaae TaxID=37293 RepID=UPI0030FF2373
MVGPLRGLFRHTLASCLLRRRRGGLEPLRASVSSWGDTTVTPRIPAPGGRPTALCGRQWTGEQVRSWPSRKSLMLFGMRQMPRTRASFLLHPPTHLFLSLQRTFREITLLQEFGEHPNIISLLDVIRAENDRDIYLVFECMDTDLNTVIPKGGLLQDVHVRSIFSQLLRATWILHSGHIVHRDQKPSNVLLCADCTVKLCDFGLARSLRDLPEGPEGQALTEYVATRWYWAPEVLLSSHRYTLGVDTWSLGCILAEMLRGKPLFPGTSTLHQLELILETIPPPSEEDLLALGSGCRASVLHHLGSRQHTAAHRPRQMLDALLPPDTSPEASDLLRRLLVFAPDKRLSATQALQHPYVQRFHCPSDEWARRADTRLRVHEGVQLSAPEYRGHVYQMILERGGSCTSREKGLEGITPGAEPRASPSQAHLCKPRANPQLSSGTPVRGHDPPEHCV